MTPLTNVGILEKRSKPTTLLYLIFITVLLLMICLVILAIVIVIGRVEVVPADSFNSKLYVQPRNTSPIFFDTKGTTDAEHLLVDIESTVALDSKKSIVEEFSPSQRPAPANTTEPSAMSFNVSVAAVSTESEYHILDTATRRTLIHQDGNSSISSSTPTSISTSTSTSTTTTATTIIQKSAMTNSTTNPITATPTTNPITATPTTNPVTATRTTMMTTSGHKNNSLSKKETLVGKYSDHLSFEPITAVRIDFENTVLEFNNSELQDESNMTSPASSSSRHEDSEELSLLMSDANSSMSNPLSSNNNRLRHKVLEEMTPQCVKKKAQKCRPSVRRNIMSREDIPSEDTVAELGHFGGIRAIHYALNLTINHDMLTSYQGTIEIMMKVIENTSTIFLHVGRPIAGIDLAQIQLWDCLSGNVLCVSSMVQHLHDDLLSIDLIESVFIGEIIILRISSFGSPRADNGLLVQNPHKWEPKRPWTVTTLFQMRDARSIMPCLDLPSMKATLDLCITHPLGTEARSNTPLRKSIIDDTIMSCFERTPPMSTYLYGITVFNRMHNMHQAADHKLQLPELEIFYPEQMSTEKPIWMKMETIQALRFMNNFTGFEYPLKKLSLVATSLPVNGVENFGLITLNERWMAYPKYRMAHSILAHEIAHQWIGNIVTVTKWSEICLQEGLTTYLEWILTAEFGNSTTNLFEILQEKRIEAIARDTKTNVSIISDFRTLEDIYRCFDKPAIFFVMLESGFGAGVVAKLTRLLMEGYAYGNAGVQEWRQLIIEAANNPLAGKFFEDYFTQPGFPLVRVAYTSGGLNLKQETMIAAKKANTSSLVVPLELSIDSSRARMKVLLNESEQTFPLKYHGIVVVDPDRTTYAVVVYEAQIYIRLLKCAQSDSCVQIDAIRMRHIAEDFCWAFLNDYIIITPNLKHETLNEWNEFMRLVSATNYVRGSCACCTNKNLSKSFNIPCKWHWKDRCEHIKLVKQIYSLVNNH